MFFNMGILSGQICSKSPVPSASLSVLEPLLSEEDPGLLEVAVDSTGFSTAKQQLCVNAFPEPLC